MDGRSAVGGFALEPFGGRPVGIDLDGVPVLQLSSSEDDEGEDADNGNQKDGESDHRREGQCGHGAVLVLHPNGQTRSKFRTGPKQLGAGINHRHDQQED